MWDKVDSGGVGFQQGHYSQVIAAYCRYDQGHAALLELGWSTWKCFSIQTGDDTWQSSCVTAGLGWGDIQGISSLRRCSSLGACLVPSQTALNFPAVDSVQC